MILITHDLGVIAEISDKVMVMYGGRTVEYGPVDEIFYNAHHPYTWGLLASLPRLDESVKTRLTPILGQPPNLITLPPGCPFTARCPYRRAAVPRQLARARERRPATTACTAGSPWRSASTIRGRPAAVQGAGGMSLLEVRDLKKHFPIRTGVLKRTTGYVYAVDGVSFNVEKGETHGPGGGERRRQVHRRPHRAAPHRGDGRRRHASRAST